MFCSLLNYATIEDVLAAYPGAARIIEVDGGWQVFAFLSDYSTWINQK
jgi:hypothetical protein